MKKKLFFTLIVVAMLVFAFAIISSATAIPEFGETECIDINATSDGVQEIDIYAHLKTVVTEGENTSASARVLLNCSCGTHTYPTYYITKKDGGDYIGFDFGDINEYNPCGKSYSSADIVAIEIPNGIKVMTNALKGNTTVKFLDMSTAETMEFVETGSGYNAVSNCTELIEVRIPASMTEIRGWSFFGCTKLERFVIPQDSELTFIGTYSFYGCTSLTGFYLPSKMKKFGTQGGTNFGVFAGCTNVYLVNEPVTPTYIPPKPDVYYFPSSFETLSGEEFKNCKSMNDTIVFPETFQTVSDKWAFCGASTQTIVFLGNINGLGAQSWSNKNFYFCNSADKSKSDLGSYTSPSGANLYFCNADGNTNHLAKLTNQTADATCTEAGSTYDLCFCGAHFNVATDVNAPALGHAYENNDIVAVVYADLAKNGTYTLGCDRCDHEEESVKEGSALFIYSGISTNGTGEICVSYVFNQEAIEIYKAVNEGAVLNFGMVACAPDYIGENDKPLNADGSTVANNVIKADLTDDNLNAVDFILRGDFSKEENAKINIAMWLYVQTNTGVYYVYNAETDAKNEASCNADIKIVTYEALKAAEQAK